MIIIEVIFGQVIGEKVKNQKTLMNFLVLSGEHKDQTILLEGAPDVPIGTRCFMSGKFSSKKRFKVAPETSNEIEIQDDLNIISEMTGISIPEEEYRTYLQALKLIIFILLQTSSQIQMPGIYFWQNTPMVNSLLNSYSM